MSQSRIARAERQNAYGTSKDQILAAAEELFARNGFSRTTLKDVARESGANTALVGYHFGSKDGLRAAVISRQLELIRQELAPLWEEQASGRGGGVPLEELVIRLIDAAARSKTLYCLHLWCLIDGSEQASQVMDEVYEPIIDALTGLVGRYWDSKEDLHETNRLGAECRAHIVFGLINQYAISKWHTFELAKLSDRQDFLDCHKSFTQSTIVNVIGPHH